jgi:hypothetical protein
VKAKLYTGKGAETRPDTVHGHVHHVTVCTDRHRSRGKNFSVLGLSLKMAGFQLRPPS